MQNAGFSLILIAAVLVVACGGAEPSLEGRTQLPLTTETRHSDACDLALLPPVRFMRTGDQITFVQTGTGQAWQIIWPMGFTAWLTDGRAQIVDGSGAVIAREGDLMDDVGGSGDPFHACDFGGRPYT
jgi:hypothetical protein